MKTKIHPQYFEKAQVICICGNRFTIGSTREIIHIELCANCHPFYTGQQRFVDSDSLIKKFENKQQAAQTYQQKKVEKIKKEKESKEGPKTLREMLTGLK